MSSDFVPDHRKIYYEDELQNGYCDYCDLKYESNSYSFSYMNLWKYDTGPYLQLDKDLGEYSEMSEIPKRIKWCYNTKHESKNIQFKFQHIHDICKVTIKYQNIRKMIYQNLKFSWLPNKYCVEFGVEQSNLGLRVYSLSEESIKTDWVYKANYINSDLVISKTDNHIQSFIVKQEFTPYELESDIKVNKNKLEFKFKNPEDIVLVLIDYDKNNILQSKYQSIKLSNCLSEDELNSIKDYDLEKYLTVEVCNENENKSIIKLYDTNGNLITSSNSANSESIDLMTETIHNDNDFMIKIDNDKLILSGISILMLIITSITLIIIFIKKIIKRIKLFKIGG